MKDLRVFHDVYGNTAMIQHIKTCPYRGAPVKEDAFRLVVKADYDDGLVYFVSIYEKVDNALEELRIMSCGTFRENYSWDEEAYAGFLKRFGGAVARSA